MHGKDLGVRLFPQGDSGRTAHSADGFFSQFGSCRLWPFPGPSPHPKPFWLSAHLKELELLEEHNENQFFPTELGRTTLLSGRKAVTDRADEIVQHTLKMLIPHLYGTVFAYTSGRAANSWLRATEQVINSITIYYNMLLLLKNKNTICLYNS